MCTRVCDKHLGLSTALNKLKRKRHTSSLDLENCDLFSIQNKQTNLYYIYVTIYIYIYMNILYLMNILLLLCKLQLQRQCSVSLSFAYLLNYSFANSILPVMVLSNYILHSVSFSLRCSYITMNKPLEINRFWLWMYYVFLSPLLLNEGAEFFSYTIKVMFSLCWSDISVH